MRCEGFQLVQCAVIDCQIVAYGVGNHLPYTGFLRVCPFDEFRERGVSDSPCGIVDDSFERFFVIGVYRQSEIGDGVLDFFPLVERHASVDAVGYVTLAQSFFNTRDCAFVR